MVLDLLIIGLAIALEPITLVAFILILGADRGLRNGLGFMFGWLVSLVAVIAAVLLLTGGQPPAPKSAPSTVALAAKAAIGAWLIWVAWRRWQHRGRPRKPPSWTARLDRLSLLTAVGMGFFLQPWGLVGAGAATVVQAKLSTAGDWLALIGFCLLATSSYLIMELYAAFAPEAASARLERIQGWIDRHTDQAIVILSLAVGCWLLGDSLYLIASAGS